VLDSSICRTETQLPGAGRDSRAASGPVSIASVQCRRATATVVSVAQVGTGRARGNKLALPMLLDNGAPGAKGE
jgi:hypothetical protein